MPHRRLLAALLALPLVALAAAPALAQEEQPPGSPDATSDPGMARTSAGDLLLLLPDEVDGQPLESSRASAAEILAIAPDPALAAELTLAAEAAGGDVSDLVLASAGVSNDEALAIVIAASIPGIDAALIEPALRAIVLPQSAEAEVTQEDVAGRSLTRFTRRGMVVPDDVAYVYTSDDVVFFIVADRVSLEEVVASLP